MRTSLTCLGVTLAAIGFLGARASAPASAAPPKVADASPDNADAGVDPSTTELRITFDQPMDTAAHSVVGGGDSFPKITGKPRWIGRHTFILPITLEPDHDYWLSINNERFTGFRGLTGEPATPYPIQFRTAPADGPPTTPDANTDEANAAAFDRLVDLLETHYSHRDRLGIDWRDLLGSRRDALVNAPTPAAFARTAATMLARAQDKHLFLEAGATRYPTFVAPRVPNMARGSMPAFVPGYERLNDAVAIGRWPDGVGYIAIDTWDASYRDDVEAAYDALWRLHDATALVIDVRLNGGGDETLAQAFAGCLIDEPVLYAKHRFVDPDADAGFGPVHERWLAPSTRRPRFTGPVVVLSGPVVMSSNEAFVLMMKAAPRATVVGANTQGSSGNPRPHELGNAVTVYLPSWQALTPDAEPFEGVGIAPDIEVKARAADFAHADPVLERALQLARSTSED